MGSDPDGLKLEIVHRPAERDLTRRVQELEARLERLEDSGFSAPRGVQR